MSKQGTIIVVDDNKGVLSAVKLLLKNHFEHIVTLPSPITLPAALREENAQVVLLDMNFSSGLNTGNEGLYWLHGSARHQGRSDRLHRQTLGQCPADRNLAVCLPQFLQEQEESGSP